MATQQGDTSATPFAKEAADLLPLIADANQRLATTADVPLDIPAVIDKLFERIPDPPDFTGIDPYLADALIYGAARSYRALTRSDERQKRRELRIALEQVRQALTYILDEAPAADDRNSAQLARWLVETIDAPQRDLSVSLGVAPRTFQRWLSGETTPTGIEASKLQMVARLVANLRHSLTGPGVLWWLQRTHPSLGKPPQQLLDDPSAYPTLVRLAAQTRSSGAA